MDIKKFFVVAAIVGVMVGVFQNCAASLEESEVLGKSEAPLPDPLVLVTSAAQVEVGLKIMLNASGGVPPYTFSVVSGPGSIEDIFYVRAGTATGTVNVQVVDSRGTITASSVAVVASTTASCTLPWGGTLAHNAAVTAYQTSSVACMGAACVSETRVCVNGSLTGSFTKQTCSVPACIYKWYNAAYTETQAQACTRVGKPAAADQGYGTCASGERRPVQGENYAGIAYNYGTFGGNSAGGTAVASTFNAANYMCYGSGQKRDNDGSDLVVAYLCREN